MDTEDLQVCLAVSSWRLDAGALRELASRSTDKGLMVTVRRASTPEDLSDSTLLELGVF